MNRGDSRLVALECALPALEKGKMTERYEFEDYDKSNGWKNFLVDGKPQFHKVDTSQKTDGKGRLTNITKIFHPKYGSVELGCDQDNILYYGEDKLVYFESIYNDDIHILELDKTGKVCKITRVLSKWFPTKKNFRLDYGVEEEIRHHTNKPDYGLPKVTFNGILGDYYVRTMFRGHELCLQALDLRPLDDDYLNDGKRVHKWTEWVITGNTIDDHFFEYSGVIEVNEKQRGLNVIATTTELEQDKLVTKLRLVMNVGIEDRYEGADAVTVAALRIGDVVRGNGMRFRYPKPTPKKLLSICEQETKETEWFAKLIDDEGPAAKKARV